MTACIFISTSRAQSTESDLNLRLKGKPLYLRGFWSDDNLHFDSTGQIIGGSSDPLTFTLSGFDLKVVRLQPNKLILEGQRVGLELVDGKQKRVPLKFRAQRRLKDDVMSIEIDANPKETTDQPSTPSLSKALPTWFHRYPSIGKTMLRRIFYPPRLFPFFQQHLRKCPDALVVESRHQRFCTL